MSLMALIGKIIVGAIVVVAQESDACNFCMDENRDSHGRSLEAPNNLERYGGGESPASGHCCTGDLLHTSLTFSEHIGLVSQKLDELAAKVAELGAAYGEEVKLTDRISEAQAACETGTSFCDQLWQIRGKIDAVTACVVELKAAQDRGAKKAKAKVFQEPETIVGRLRLIDRKLDLLGSQLMGEWEDL